MRPVTLAAIATGLAISPNAVLAEENWILARSSISAPLGSPLIISYLAVEETEASAVEPSLLMNGRAFLPAETEVQVSVPLNVLEFFEIGGGVIETEEAQVEFDLVSQFTSINEPLINTYIYTIEAQNSARGTVTLHDDPHPLLVPAIIGASYIAICGGIYLLESAQQCDGERSLDIGIHLEERRFGCTIECSAS
jgi:hypothetical protein